MSKRRSTENKRCLKCKINKRLCFCSEIQSIQTETHISIIMHHREEHLTSNTANLITMAMPNTSEITKCGEKDTPFPLDTFFIPNRTPLFLFPHENALPLDQFVKSNPVQLIVPDGSWNQARKFHRRIPGMNQIPCVKLPNEIRIKNYTLRNHYSPQALCTYEAIAYALTYLESDIGLDKILFNLKLMNERVLFSRNHFS